MVKINISMPKNCYDCLFNAGKPYSTRHRCIAAYNRQIDTSLAIKPPWCPLVDVGSGSHGEKAQASDSD